MNRDEIIDLLKDCRARWTKLNCDELRPRVIEQLAIPEDKGYMTMLEKLEMKTAQHLSDTSSSNSKTFHFYFDDNSTMNIYYYNYCFWPGTNRDDEVPSSMRIVRWKRDSRMDHTIGSVRYIASRKDLTFTEDVKWREEISEEWIEFAKKLFTQLDHQKLCELYKKIVAPREVEIERTLI